MDENNFVAVLTFDLSSIEEISTIKISVLPNNLIDENNKKIVFDTLKLLSFDTPEPI